jgi:hypothetical protein
MISEANIPTLSSLEYVAYLDEEGKLSEDLQGKIGVYAIFNQEKVLQLIGYSRDMYLSLKQHLVRQPKSCYWLKFQTIERPSRSILESIQTAWIEENGATPLGNSTDAHQWNEPIDAKEIMTDAEKANYLSQDGLGQVKLLKNVARRLEEQILAELKTRGVAMEIRFNPKLKESGLLDLK